MFESANNAINNIIAKNCRNPYSIAYDGNKVFSAHIPAKQLAIYMQIASGIKYINSIFNPLFCVVVVDSSLT